MNEPDWVKAYQPDRLLKAQADWRAPLRRRVVDAALGRMRRNGHANFGEGELRGLLAVPVLDDEGEPIVDKDTGQLLTEPRSKFAVSRAIKAAVDAGDLAPGSSARCLIVPGHVARGGGRGRAGDPCRWCDKPNARRARYAAGKVNKGPDTEDQRCLSGSTLVTNVDPQGQLWSDKVDPEGQRSCVNPAAPLLILPPVITDPHAQTCRGCGEPSWACACPPPDIHDARRPA